MCILSRAAVALVVLLGITEDAPADLRYQPVTTDKGVRILIVSGKFEMSDDVRLFQQAVLTHRPTGVVFQSPGGAVYKAMEVGRLIRSERLTTVQPKLFECASACAWAFLGGVQRMAEPGAIGVHQSSLGSGGKVDPREVPDLVQRVTADIIAYVAEMGVDPKLVALAMQYSAEDIRYLSASEMAQYRVTASTSQSRPAPQPQPIPSIPRYSPVEHPYPPSESQPSTLEPRLPSVPVAKTGKVRHPNGFALLHVFSSEDSTATRRIPNRYPLRIIGSESRWYKVVVENEIGYLRHNWVKVDQFVQSSFERRYIQIKSFDDLGVAERYVREASLLLAIYLASNGWYAVTLDGTFEYQYSYLLANQLKENGRIPDDSYVTNDNTYMVRVR